MNKPSEHQLTQWIDRTLPSAETGAVEEWLAAHPQERKELEEMRAMSAVMASTHAPPVEMPAGEFFMHQLERRLDEADALPAAAAVSGESKSPWKQMATTVLAAAAIAVLAAVITLRVGDKGATTVADNRPMTELRGIYTPQDSVEVDAFYADDADAEVVILDGLPDVAGNTIIAGFGAEGEAHQRWLASMRLESDPALGSVPAESEPIF